MAHELFESSSIASHGFNPSAFLIPGWEGGSLASKSSLYLKKVQKSLLQDAIAQFNGGLSFNQSLKKKIHWEFLDFSRAYQLELNDLEKEGVFWDNLYDEYSPHREELDIFVRKFCLKAVNLYIYKVKFVVTLASEKLASVDPNNLINPHSFFARTFCFGGPRDLMCKALQRNTYSWYHPSADCAETIIRDRDSFAQISTAELMLLTRLNEESETDTLTYRKNYSHSFSHKLLGLLLNSLMIYFPIWKKREKFSYPLSLKDGYPEVLNTKFEGDYINSLTYSHWLAQECNQEMLWSEILCPGFMDEHFENGSFLHHCHELQFLIFLASYSKKYQAHPLNFIAKVMRDKYNKSEEVLSGQPSLFSRYDLKRKLLYDRIVLSVCDLPETNPHHFLLNRMQRQAKSLSPGGYLTVLSNQNLFIASQSAKIHQLMEQFQLEFYLNLEELQGKGEIPQYIYVFSKVSSNRKKKSGVGYRNTNFHTLQWSGNLTPFEKMRSFLDELENFFQNKNPVTTPLYQKDFAGGLCFKFQQDAILEGGLLLSSTAKNSTRITHPNFFKNLTQTCSPLENFFTIEQLGGGDSSELKQAYTVGLLGVSVRREQQFPHVLIIDYTHDFQVNLEIISSKSYRAKLKKYGQAFYQYFGLTPKIAGLDINLFREFFSMDLGRQVIQLCLQGGMKKSKAKLKSLLIPNVFSHPFEAVGVFKDEEHFFHSKSDKIRQYHPEFIIQEWEKGKEIFSSDKEMSPRFQMHLLAHLKYQIMSAMSHSDLPDKRIDFNNDLIKCPLVDLSCHPIYPKSDDIYIEFLTKKSEDLQSFCEEFQLNEREDGSSLALISEQGEVIIRLHSESSYLEFAHYILSSAKGKSFAFLIKNLRLPRLDDFKEVLRNYEMMDDCLQDVHDDVKGLLGRIITQQIISS